MLNTICINHSAANVITSGRFNLKQIWWLKKPRAKTKCEHWTKRWNWSNCTKLALSGSWTDSLVPQSVRESERNSVVVGSNPTQANFLELLLKSLQWWIPHVSIIHSAGNVITCRRFQLKQMWGLKKAISEVKCEHWTKRWNCSSCTKLGECKFNWWPDSSVG